jgi:hypothetical protein
MRKLVLDLTRSSALLVSIAISGCGDKPAPTPEPTAPAKPARVSPPTPTDDAKGWKAGQPLPPGVRASRPTPPEVTGTAEVICQELLGKINHDKYFARVLQVDGVTVPPPANLFPNAKVKFALAGVPKPFSTERWDVVGTPAPGDEEKVKALAPGRSVRVVGYVIGTAGVLGMEQCVVTDLGPGPEPTPVREATAVTADFAKDAAAARKKYGLPDDAPAILLLRGKVTECAAKGDAGTYRLAGADGATVLVAMKVDQYTKVPEVGKTVTAGGVFDGYDAASRSLKLVAGSVIPY